MASRGRALADRIVMYYGDNQPGFGRGIEINDGDQIRTIAVDDTADLNAALQDLEQAGLLRFVTGANVDAAGAS